MRTLLTAAAAVLVVTLATGCGGDSDSSADGTADEPRPTESTSAAATPTDTDTDIALEVTDGITPDDLVGCLSDAGLDAASSDSVPFGVEVPVVEVEVTGMTDYSDGTDQGAQLWVFADPASAADNAATLTLGASDDPANSRFGVHQNVVRAMSIILAPDPHTDDENALLGCLPS